MKGVANRSRQPTGLLYHILQIVPGGIREAVFRNQYLGVRFSIQELEDGEKLKKQKIPSMRGVTRSAGVCKYTMYSGVRE